MLLLVALRVSLLAVGVTGTLPSNGCAKEDCINHLTWHMMWVIGHGHGSGSGRSLEWTWYQDMTQLVFGPAVGFCHFHAAGEAVHARKYSIALAIKPGIIEHGLSS